MIVLDTTVLVYAKGAEHPLRDPCRNVIASIERGGVDASTTAEVVQEFAHVRARRRSRADAAELAIAYALLLSPLVQVGEAEVRAGMSLFARMPELGAFDAVLAAAAISHGADALVSADAAFGRVRGLRHLHPASDELREILGERD